MERKTAAIATFALSGLILAGLYFVFLQPQGGAAVSTAAAPKIEMAVAPSPRIEEATPLPKSNEPAGNFLIAIEDVRPGVVIPALRVRQGDPVTIAITTDRPGTLEIHGYGRKIALKPGTEAILSFDADRTGRFPIDLHGRDGRHLEVTALEIQPR